MPARKEDFGLGKTSLILKEPVCGFTARSMTERFSCVRIERIVRQYESEERIDRLMLAVLQIR